jgi:hypothetical protein
MKVDLLGVVLLHVDVWMTVMRLIDVFCDYIVNVSNNMSS